MQDEQGLLAFVAAGGKLDAPEHVLPRYRGEVMRLMAVFVDSEMAGASGFADCINLAPGLKERMIAARIVQEKFSHAGKVLTLMEQFGARTELYVGAHPWAARLDRAADLGHHRQNGDMRLNVFHYPIYGWLDAVTMNTLMGRATAIQLDELTRCSYQPLASAMLEVLPVETRHAALGEAGLRDALARGADPVAAQAAVNYWYPRVAASFGRAGSGHFETYRKFGLRQRSNETVSSDWHAAVGSVLESLALAIPQSASA